ncbi:GTP-binding nuclear protein Ran-like [Drosophila pseudoobscura]|uniref:GTP-binding nuclear protein Ran-like n=1 Tax=Drosophila pseudoobscura pseudoobscura TaxID=46245 RepID=B5DNK1_DROPS|nr:GTP-binding nuclear protein Ran [Drosophila pseudoobscura]XP_015042056.1 GTP-binding nuclear protein Ran [Drosophila pseudoobscura]
MATGRQEVPTVKCIIVGNEGCGKSSFIQRHLTGQFMQQYMPTFGITVIKLIFQTTRGPICFEMWEGGKAEYVRSEGPNPFFKKVQCAIVMFDVSLKDPAKNFAAFRAMTERVSPDVLKYVCGNKADVKLSKPNNRRKKIYRCTKMSVKTDVNTLVPFQHLARRIFKDSSLQLMSRTTMLPAPVEHIFEETEVEEGEDH